MFFDCYMHLLKGVSVFIVGVFVLYNWHGMKQKLEILKGHVPNTTVMKHSRQLTVKPVVSGHLFKEVRQCGQMKNFIW